MADEKKSTLHVKGEELVNKVKELVHEGNVRRIVISDDKGKQLLEVPLTLGLIGLVMAPVLAVLGTVGAMAMNYQIQIIRQDEEKDSGDKEKKA
jgi:hypothetical protein